MARVHGVRIVFSVLVSSVLAGCGGAGGTASRPCPSIAAAPPALVSPANGATSVSTSVGSIVVSGATTTETLRLTSAGGSATLNAGPLQTQTGGTTQTASLPALAAGTTYTVVADNIPLGCGGISAPIGIFSTS